MCDLWLWADNLWPNQIVRTLARRGGVVRSFPRHQRLLQDPHFIQGNCPHHEKTQHHQHVTGQHRQDEDRRDICDQPGRDQIEHNAAEAAPGDESLESMARVSEVRDMDKNHENDGHREQVEVRDLSQFAEGHRLAECRIRASIVVCDARR
jgi:hypothetical protein